MTSLRGRAVGHPVIEQARFHQRLPYPRDFSAAKLDQRRPHHSARQLAEQHQRLLHTVMHVCPRLGVKTTGQRFDAVVQAASFRQIIALDRLE